MQGKLNDFLYAKVDQLDSGDQRIYFISLKPEYNDFRFSFTVDINDSELFIGGLNDFIDGKIFEFYHLDSDGKFFRTKIIKNGFTPPTNFLILFSEPDGEIIELPFKINILGTTLTSLLNLFE